ncbi:MAG: putative DNA helicase MCM8 [Streblomastix strix]|uniref:DNA helicase n=1 Tax=Streblomastix strix TaxID=222440 RepID=A0A5J4X8B8_9EUKA|nr:MAG: putative DNA helicase MCM8 [Streblomastix strix]
MKHGKGDMHTCPYIGWSMYFPGESFEENAGIKVDIEKWIDFFSSKYALALSQNDQTRRFIINFDALVLRTIPPESKLLQGPALSNFMTNMEQEHDTIVRIIGLAAHQVIFRDGGFIGLPYSDRTVAVRISNYRILSLRDIKSNYINRFVSIKGTVVRVGPVRPLVIEATFVCLRCEARITMAFPEGRYRSPSKCYTDGCKSHIFNIDKRSIQAVDWQKIRIQEIITDYKDSGRVPRTIECELTEELVGSCIPGDIATVSGAARIVSIDSEGTSNSGGNQQSNRGGGNQRGYNNWRGRGGRGSAQVVRKPQTLFLLYIFANNITTSRDGIAIPDPSTTSPFSTARDVALIRKVVLRPNLFTFLTNSLAPNIYGHHQIKQGFLLALFGGTVRIGQGNLKGSSSNAMPAQMNAQGNAIAQSSGESMVNTAYSPIRSSIHVLIVGDPGMGKSQMLRAVASATPRGVYVCGNTTTSSGLTVTVVKEGGDFALEAGALILGDRGTCCIDEFDKMGHEHQSLLEAMEQQSISIAKGGMVCSLQARTSVLAAANPSGGHYDLTKTVSENLRLSPMILSRFDLVFVMMDKPDVDIDSRLSDHLVRMHAQRAENPEEFDRRRTHEEDRWFDSTTSTRDNSIIQSSLSESQRSQKIEYSNGVQIPFSIPAPAQFADKVGYRNMQESAFNSQFISSPSPLVPHIPSTLSTPRIQHTQHNFSQQSSPLVPISQSQASMGAASLIDQPLLDLVPCQHLRRYIAYARAHCHPHLTGPARRKLRDYFIELRRIHHTSDAAVVTARQLESLVRLAEARAKCELREEVTESDAQEAIDLMKKSLYENLATETGLVDVTRASGMSRQKDSQRLMRALNSLAQQRGNSLFTKSEIFSAARACAITKDITALIDKMNQSGQLLLKGNKTYKLTSGEY